MSHRPYKPTEIKREAIVQEARVIVPPEPSAPVGSFRQVQVLVPPSPKLFVGVDVTAEEIGPNRTYKLPEMPPGQMIRFRLLPGQFLLAAVAENFAPITVIIEHLGGE